MSIQLLCQMNDHHGENHRILISFAQILTGSGQNRLSETIPTGPGWHNFAREVTKQTASIRLAGVPRQDLRVDNLQGKICTRTRALILLAAPSTVK